MATPTTGNSASAPPHTIVPAPIATNDQHVCFICLQNDTDTPNATWVNPCPCSLEAHEGCLLRWIAEMEASSSNRPSRSGLKCPACKAPITVEEPFDALLAIRDRLYRRYSRAAPYILLVLVSGGTLAGATWYGCGAASIFAGTDAVEWWMDRSHGRARLPILVGKFWALSTIGPGLIIMRWLPWLGSIVLVPISALYGAFLVAHEDLPQWPPSPEWAMALMPYVHLGYTFLYYDLFGPLERRLNRALRGRPPTDEAGAGEEAAVQAAAAPPAEGRNGNRANGIWGTVVNLGRAALGLVLDWRVEVEIEEEVEFRIGPADDNEDGHAHDEDDEEEEFQILAGDAPAEPAQLPPPPPPPPAQPPAAAPAQPQANPNPQDHNNNQQQPNNHNNNNNDAPPETPYLTEIINSMVTSLLFPAISYGMGELIRVAAPRAWVRPWRGPGAPTGLLQERWGRSLVGGCLFVVLRDAVALYTKYRRVQVKANRKVRSVERRRDVQEGLRRGAGAGVDGG